MTKSLELRRHPVILGLAILGAVWAPASAQTALSGGPATFIYHSDPPMDAVAATLKRDGTTMWLWQSDWYQTVKWYGTPGNPRLQRHSPPNQQSHQIFALPIGLQSTVRITPNPVPYVTSIPNYKCVSVFLKNVHNLGNGELLGFLHLEYFSWIQEMNANNQWTGRYYPAYHPVLGGANYYSIGMAYSNNNGDSWTFLGDIVRTHEKAPNLLSANIGGAAYVRVGDYLYVYFNEKPVGSAPAYPSVARALLTDISNAARGSNTTPWKKYNAATQAFDQDAINGLGSQIIAEPGLDLHSDAAYNSALKQYLLTVYDGKINAVKILRSNDAINWFSPTVLATSYIVSSNNNLHVPCYPYFYSLDADANTDNSVVGKNFNMFYVNQHTPSTGYFQPSDQPVYRVGYKLTDPLPIEHVLR